MTGHIINPSWFYWLNVVDAARTFFGVIVVFSIGGMIASTIGYLICHRVIADLPDFSDGEKSKPSDMETHFKNFHYHGCGCRCFPCLHTEQKHLDRNADRSLCNIRKC